MRILQITKKQPFIAKDGEAIAILNITEQLAMQGCEVSVLSMSTPKHHFNASEIPEKYMHHINWESVFVHSNVSYFNAFLNIFNSKPYHVQRFLSAKFSEKLVSILEQNIFDIVQLEGLYLTPYIQVIRLYSKAKIVYRSHNIEGIIWRRIAKNEKQIFKKIYLNFQSKKLIRFESKILNQVDAILPISLADFEFYKEYYPKVRCHYLPSGISSNMYLPYNEEINYNTIYFLGALDWLPNQEGLKWFIQHVLQIIEVKFPNVECHIAGRNAPKWMYQLINSSVHFHGEVEDAQAFIRDKFICIVPLLSGSGMKIKIIEALAMNKAVVTTNVGSEGMPKELIETLLIANTPSEFADAILACLCNPSHAEKRAIQGNKFVNEKLDNSKLVKELVQLYKLI